MAGKLPLQLGLFDPQFALLLGQPQATHLNLCHRLEGEAIGGLSLFQLRLGNLLRSHRITHIDIALRFSHGLIVFGRCFPLLHLRLTVIDPGDHLVPTHNISLAHEQLREHSRLPRRHLRLLHQRDQTALEHRLRLVSGCRGLQANREHPPQNAG